nr:hypothetical protein [Mycolicibacterium sp.]
MPGGESILDEALQSEFGRPADEVLLGKSGNRDVVPLGQAVVMTTTKRSGSSQSNRMVTRAGKESGAETQGEVGCPSGDRLR